MPKIIENPSEKLIAEACRQVTELGYAAMNIRSVAKNCGVGVGTVYNYFPSKDALVAGFLLEDWKECLQRIRQDANSADRALAAVSRELTGFRARYADLFRSASENLPAPPRQYHRILRSQLAEILLPFCADSFCAEFAAEAMITWTSAGTPPEILLPLVQKILR